MNLRQPVTARTAIVVVLVVIYAAALVALIASSRREAAVTAQVKATEASLVQATSNAENTLPVLQANLAAAKEKLATLESVQGTVTHFLLKRYKEDGEIIEDAGVKPKREPLTL